MTESELLDIETWTSRANGTVRELLFLMKLLNDSYSKKKSLENSLKRQKLCDDIDLKQTELNDRLKMLLLEISKVLAEPRWK